MGVTRTFYLAHEHQFERMEGLGVWYAKQNVVLPANNPSKKHKSDVLGSAPRRPIGLSNVRARRNFLFYFIFFVSFYCPAGRTL